MHPSTGLARSLIVAVLRGPSAVDVWFETGEGEARDDDGDGREEVMTKMVQLDLWGQSSMGPVHVTLNPGLTTTGEIEERVNNTPGLLDIAPFAAGGSADSFFDVFFQIEVAGQVLQNQQPKHMSRVIVHKPPEPGAVYEGPERIELFVPNGQPSGFSLGPARHVPSSPMLQPGDANQDLQFNQLDIIAVLQANKYLTRQPATWAEGDWNEAPGGTLGNPPPGDGVFDQKDIVAAQKAWPIFGGRI